MCFGNLVYLIKRSLSPTFLLWVVGFTFKIGLFLLSFRSIICAIIINISISRQVGNLFVFVAKIFNRVLFGEKECVLSL